MHAVTDIKYQFPVRQDNRFALLTDGDVFFKAMLAAIDAGQGFILLEQYLVKSGRITSRFIDHLCQAAGRGVEVYVLLDDFGSSEMAWPDRRRLFDAGVRLCMYNPVHFKHFFHNLFRNHRKCLIVDGHTAYIGGAGLADEFSAEMAGPLAWHDVMLELQGPAVQDWCELFRQTWSRQSALKIDLPPCPSVTAGTQRGRLLCAAPFTRQDINRSLIKHLRRCQQRAWVTSPYFVAPHKIRRLLRQVARRGVDVRLLLPGYFSDHPWISFAARRHYMRLLRSGVRIFEYQPRFIHAKIELCDDYWVSLGSSNLDRWNLRWNLDANQAVFDPGFAREVEGLFLRDFTNSVEITLEEWQRRPWLTRLREALAGLVIFWLERLLRTYR